MIGRDTLPGVGKLQIAMRVFGSVCLLVAMGPFWLSARAAEPSTRPGKQSADPSMEPVELPPGVVIDGPTPPLPPATMSRDPQNRVTVRAVRVNEPMRLDGRLDEGVYETVPPMTGFFQSVPDDGEPATEETEAWVFFDDENVYVTARCWDSAPESEWVANEMRRNTTQLRQNDTFGVMFDTFYDRRNGYFFYTNPLGARADRYYTDETNTNADLLPIWDVRPGRFDGGWTVEIMIPFKSLRYQQGISQVWGIQMRRAIRRRNEWTYFSPVPINAARSGSAAIFRISLAGTLVGIEAPPVSRNLEVKPYGISRVTNDDDVDEWSGDIGVDVKYGVTENLTADFTYNTDFAQVEVDEQQVNLTRFPLFFPEKREFFQEGRGTFDFGGAVGGSRFTSGETPTVFYSRRIGLESGEPVAIYGGARLTGEVGKYSIGAFNMQTDDLRLNDQVVVPSTNFTVIRVKRDILRRSRIGGIFTGRSKSTTVGDGSNQVYGADAAFSFYENLNFSGYLARSQTQGLDGDDLSYEGRFSYEGDLYGARASHLLVDANFNPEVGFLRRRDLRQTFGSLRYSPRPRSIEAVRKFTFEGSFNYILNGAGEVETRTSQASFNTEFENSDRFRVGVTGNYELLVELFDIADGVTIPPGGYDFSDVVVSYTLGGQRRLNGSLSVRHGQFYDGDISAVGFSSGRFAVLPQFSLEPSFSVNWVDLPEGEFTTGVARLRANYSFTPRMYVSGLVQYNSGNDSMSTNLRLRWEYRPGSELFVVYTDQRDTMALGFPALENRAFVVKINRLFRF